MSCRCRCRGWRWLRMLRTQRWPCRGDDLTMQRDGLAWTTATALQYSVCMAVHSLRWGTARRWPHGYATQAADVPPGVVRKVLMLLSAKAQQCGAQPEQCIGTGKYARRARNRRTNVKTPGVPWVPVLTACGNARGATLRRAVLRAWPRLPQRCFGVGLAMRLGVVPCRNGNPMAGAVLPAELCTAFERLRVLLCCER